MASQKSQPDIIKILPRPDSLSTEALGFERKGMVSWHDPWQLIQTGIKSVLSDLFGKYADKRELLSVLGKTPLYDHRNEADEEGNFWLDYVADSGDGFHSTYTVALTAASKSLLIKHAGMTHALNRGRVFIFGGDGVYPTAAREDYRNRLLGPYSAALPWSEEQKNTLYAIPGNHDWYDGLTSFLRIFGQKRWLGAWKTAQTRSYFALQLPQGWWLWGIDIQLESDIDYPQIDFFKQLAVEVVKKGERIILCTAEPSWSHYWLGKKTAFDTLAFFELKIIRANGLNLVLTLSGDIHNYHRYQREDATLQRLTVGGGGAFLHATHFLPENKTNQKITLPENEVGVEFQYQFQKAFPNHQESRDLSKKARWTFFKCRTAPTEGRFDLDTLTRSYGFVSIIAVYYLVLSWVLQSASMKTGITLAQHLYKILDERGTDSAIWNALKIFWYLFSSSPSVCVFAMILPVGLIAFCNAKKFKRFCIGSLHALMHLGTFIFLFISLTVANYFMCIPVNYPMGVGITAVHPTFVLIFTMEMLVFGFFLAGINFGQYLVWFQKYHGEEVFSFQGIEDWKNFLKIRIDQEGQLWLYPIGIRNICRKWKPNPGGKPDEPWIVPEKGTPNDWVSLIEGPLCFNPTTERWVSKST